MSSSPHPVPQEAPSHKDGREVEWQLASTDLASVRRWLDDHGTIDGLVLEPRSTLKIFDTYFDTDDWRIHRAGFALRIRSEDGKSEATLKSLRSNSTEMADRRELSETLESTESESIARSKAPLARAYTPSVALIHSNPCSKCTLRDNDIRYTRLTTSSR